MKSSLQRVFYPDEQGREATLVFSYPPSFGGVVDAFMLRHQSKYYHETLTPCAFLRAGFGDLQEVMRRYPGVETVIRLGLTAALSGVLERLVELQCYSSAEKFKKLLTRSPHILQLVPHKYLANYIGVDVNRVKIPLSIASLIQIPIGDILHFMVIHTKRHILQANRNVSQATLVTQHKA